MEKLPKCYEPNARHTLLRIIEHFSPKVYFRTSYPVGAVAALGDHIHNKKNMDITKQVPTTSVHKYLQEEKK